MQQRFTNQMELRVVGLSRSGNHAIINWILSQARGRYCFLNCAEGKSNPFITARPMDDGLPYQTNIVGFDLVAEQRRRCRRKDLLLVSYEDSFLGHALSDEYEREHDDWVGRSRRRLDVLILRDPLNLFASRLRSGHDAGVTQTAARVWKQHARAFTAPDRYFRHEPVRIAYNRWCADESYRRSIATQLGLTFTDAGRDRVASCNGGSSFDALRYDGAAERMKVLERWRRYIDNDRYIRHIDPTMLDLTRTVFGDLPGVRAVGERRRALSPSTVDAQVIGRAA